MSHKYESIRLRRSETRPVFCLQPGVFRPIASVCLCGLAFAQIHVLALSDHRFLAIVATAPPVLKYASNVSLFQPVKV